MDDWVVILVLLAFVFALYLFLGHRSAQLAEAERKRRIISDLPITKQEVARALRQNAKNKKKGKKDTPIDFSLFEDVSPLKILGYAVGETGLQKSDRRKVLKWSIYGDLQRYMPDGVQYDRRWGQPGSGTRFYAVAKHLQLVKNLRSRRASMSVARMDWSEDIAWINREKNELYKFRIFDG